MNITIDDWEYFFENGWLNENGLETYRSELEDEKNLVEQRVKDVENCIERLEGNLQDNYSYSLVTKFLDKP